MGQYYKPVLLSPEGTIVAWFDAIIFGNGYKMMEHAYVGCGLMDAVESYLYQHRHLGLRLVWAGDYSETYEDEDKQMNLYNLCRLDTCVKGSEIQFVEDLRWIVNHTKKCFIDKTTVGEIHPLPLLTSETDQNASGDYNGIHDDLLGLWARDVITMETEKPNTSVYSEFRVVFVFEEY